MKSIRGSDYNSNPSLFLFYVNGEKNFLFFVEKNLYSACKNEENLYYMCKDKEYPHFTPPPPYAESNTPRTQILSNEQSDGNCNIALT